MKNILLIALLATVGFFFSRKLKEEDNSISRLEAKFSKAELIAKTSQPSKSTVNLNNCRRNLMAVGAKSDSNRIIQDSASGDVSDYDSRVSGHGNLSTALLPDDSIIVVEDWLVKTASIVEEKYFSIIYRFSNEFGVNPRLVVALITKESAGDPSAVSEKGAIGLMQIMPGTASSLYGVSDKSKLYDPELNIKLGIMHLRRLYDLLPNQSTDIVLSAYNQGENGIINDIDNGRKPNIKIPVITYARVVFWLSRNYTSYNFG